MMSNFNLIPIALSGHSGSGKDTLYIELSKNFPNLNCLRVSLGDILKKEINNFCLELFKISALTQNREEKELIRPVMVSSAAVLRKQTKGTYFTNRLTPLVLNSIKHNYLPIITDLRFADPEYPNDELFWFRSLNGKLIYIELLKEDGSLVPPANSEEAKNNPILKENADLVITWKNMNLNDISSHVNKVGQFILSCIK